MDLRFSLLVIAKKNLNADFGLNFNLYSLAFKTKNDYKIIK